MPWKQITLDDILSEPGGSVYCDDTTSIMRIFDFRLSYRKGAYLLHMLRWELGDSAFFTALRNYLNDSSLAFSYATVDDLKHYFEIAGDTIMDEFFNDWYYAQGYPMFDINYSQDENNILMLEITQQPSYDNIVFDITLPIVAYYDGNDTLLKIDVHNQS
jgi:aminopeptidase N